MEVDAFDEKYISLNISSFYFYKVFLTVIKRWAFISVGRLYQLSVYYLKAESVNKMY